MPDKAPAGPITTEPDVPKHYATNNIVSRILAALRAVNGPDAPITPDTLAPIDHFHGKGVIATEELAAALQPQPADHLLDIGCGIGGPARWIAVKYRCHVTGVDLTEEFCEAARELDNLTRLADRVRILHGSALALPVQDCSFDRAYSQAVLMNISDKLAFAREAFRALRPGGVLAVSLVGAGPAGEPYYPLPWASTPATSFLATPDQFHADLRTAGFEIVSSQDTSPAAAAAFAPILERLETEGLPILGEHVVTGEDARKWRINAMRSLINRRTSMIEVVARRRGN